MKKYISLVLVMLIALTGCSQGTPRAGEPSTDAADLSLSADSGPTGANTAEDPSPEPVPDPGRALKIVSTIFPQYDWVRQILGDRAGHMELTLLQSSLTDLHNYQPTVEDIAKISTCDLFIYIGGESDQWVESALRQAINPDMTVINLLETLGDRVKAEEALEGPADDHHGHHHHHDDDDDEHGHDEHVWLSLRLARVACDVITEAIAVLDPGYEPDYRINLAGYIEKLAWLDMEYQAAADAAPVKTLLFGDRFPFRYLVDDYGINYYAAFSGCSAETEASFETIVFLTKKIDELHLNVVMVTEGSNQSIAKTVIGSTKDKNQMILVLNSMQSVTSSDAESGTTYLSIMESNLGVLIEALQ